jgi:hypothetical protein
VCVCGQKIKRMQPQTHTDAHRQKNLGLCLNASSALSGKPGTRAPQASNLLLVRLQRQSGVNIFTTHNPSGARTPVRVRPVCVRLCGSVAKKSKRMQPQTHTDPHRQKNLGLCLNVSRRCQENQARGRRRRQTSCLSGCSRPSGQLLPTILRASGHELPILHQGRHCARTPFR